MNRSRYDYLWKHYPNQEVEEVWDFINNVLNKRSINSILEIGVELGGSGSMWCDLCKEGGFYIGVDLDVSRRLRSFDDEYKTKLDLHFIDGDSTKESTIAEVKEIIDRKGGVDFIFLDGEHKYETVISDVVNYYTFLRSGGVFGFHDYLQEPVYRAIGDLKKEELIAYSSDGLFTCEHSRATKAMGIYYFIKE